MIAKMLTIEEEKQFAIDPNPPHGTRGEFRKVTVSLPQKYYEVLVRESARRKIAGEPNHLLSAILREAIDEYLHCVPQVPQVS